MLPSRPKIFYGRELELQEIVTNLTLGSARIAILGAGGMGKTSLARAALHHPEVTAKYAHRIFVAADSVTDKVGLVTLIASHIGLQPAPYLTKRVVQYFSKCSSVLLILDNLETAWEPMNSRGEVEGFLSFLTDVGHLALVVSTSSLFFSCYQLINALDHNAWGTTTCPSLLDPSIPVALETNMRPCCLANFHQYYRQFL
jgi:hypothetical protein